ncbi:MAG: thioredoxin-disulfide reductase [Oscillospiraceae bacterium]|nr:thioredoxin-disulfide reductase [Oscillospiraceae bacterium]MBQ3560712.1 thioredoxin-disulfide reductase [Oscillospiraceae bacterium]
MYDIIIIGAGTAGLTAAIYGQRAGLSCKVFEKYAPGGQIVNSPSIENYPGMYGVSGYDYSIALLEQAQKLGAEVEFAEVTGVDFSGKTKKVVTSAEDFEAKAVIIANGAARRKIGCKGEEEFEGRGVSYCATCDGAFFRGKTVAVVGGGESAFEEAEYLAEICDKVYLIHRRDVFTAAKTAVDSLLKKKNVTLLTNSVIEEIKGENAVSSAVIKNRANQSKVEVPLSAVFVAIGLVPENGLYKDVLTLDEYGYFDAAEDCKTNIEGVFAAGDTRKKQLRQLVTAASDGAAAATAAANYIRKNF